MELSYSPPYIGLIYCNAMGYRNGLPIIWLTSLLNMGPIRRSFSHQITLPVVSHRHLFLSCSRHASGPTNAFSYQSIYKQQARAIDDSLGCPRFAIFQENQPSNGDKRRLTACIGRPTCCHHGMKLPLIHNCLKYGCRVKASLIGVMEVQASASHEFLWLM